MVAAYLPSPHLSASEAEIDLFETRVSLCVPGYLEACGFFCLTLLSAGLERLVQPIEPLVIIQLSVASRTTKVIVAVSHIFTEKPRSGRQECGARGQNEWFQ